MGNASRRILLIFVAIVALITIALGWVFSDRPDPQGSGLRYATPAASPDAGEPRLSATWLGVSTLLFDDGETQVLVDGFISRPGLLDLVLARPVAPDPGEIADALEAVGASRLAAVVVAHSHYDHAMDSGEVARQTGAKVLGSRSTANAARGSKLGEAQIIEAVPGQRYAFGAFEVRLLESRHVRLVGGEPPMPGEIESPLELPAPITAWRLGGAYSILIDHPGARLLVQGSAGYLEGALAGEQVDHVFLGVGGLERLSPEYTRAYWHEMVEVTRARRVFPVHWDDFTRPYGEIVPIPRVAGDVSETFARLQDMARDGAAPRPVAVELMRFGEPVGL